MEIISVIMALALVYVLVKKNDNTALTTLLDKTAADTEKRVKAEMRAYYKKKMKGLESETQRNITLFILDLSQELYRERGLTLRYTTDETRINVGVLDFNNKFTVLFTFEEDGFKLGDIATIKQLETFKPLLPPETE